MKQPKAIKHVTEKAYTFTMFLKDNWKMTIFIVGIVIFLAFQTMSSAANMAALNGVLDSKTNEIKAQQLQIEELENNMRTLNATLIKAQDAMKKQTKVFWTKFNKIKAEAETQTPEQILESWVLSWPGGR